MKNLIKKGKLSFFSYDACVDALLYLSTNLCASKKENSKFLFKKILFYPAAP
jgi:hypothetical protein